MKALTIVSVILAIVMVLINPINIKLLNLKALIVLATFMVVSEIWSKSGLFPYLASKLSGISLAFLSYIAGAILMNDAAILIMTPLAALKDISAVPYVAALVNLGSSITPFGNPQNVIIWVYYSLHPLDFLMLFPLTLPPALYAAFKLKGLKTKIEVEKPRGLPICIFSLVVSIVLVELNLSLVALVVAILFYFMSFRGVPKIQWDVLITLAAMMVGFGGLSKLLNVPKVDCFLEAVLLSQVLSNVPVVMMFLGCPWLPLAAGVDLGGLGTPIASLANLIAIKISRIDVKEFVKAQVPLLLLALSTYPLVQALQFLHFR